MTITKVEQNLWTNFLLKMNKNTFLHSLEWVEFNEKDHKIWRLGMFDQQNNLISICLIIKIEAKRGWFLLVPHGPQYLNNLDSEVESEILKFWTLELTALAKKEACCFIRVQPILINNSENQQKFINLGYKNAPMHMHTELTSVLKIDFELKKILMNMRKTTRQMIKKGEKMIDSKEIRISFPTKISTEMHKVYQDTYRRGGAVAYSKDYINREWEVFSKRDNAKLVEIRHQNTTISWGLVLVSGKRAFYHHGGNILVKNVPGSYLVQWYGIKFAKEKDCQTYDFWGVSPANNPNHPWANISLFKRGFGGQDVELLHAQDFVVSCKYWLNWSVEIIRAKKRGFG